MELNNLITEIAAYRRIMNRLSMGKSLTDPDVIRSREGLDILLHKYYLSLNVCRYNERQKFYKS